ncbi:lytic transglycosylase domain-containing protein [Streptomyces sp. NBC_01751]|uniref:lytic transglycosylase domain-containing protein n=1 Tax=Streptomyces sp. NBC_01751 TaxID=2975929 RepID=UPI002DDA030B|nr:transglycosylase SLT domain-containing protein [Streptomyces sp. NBC_01751]WSD24551.1 transglycosylase SLT domain-containing protein [Streptomyces sp. NBC_01751]
MPEAGSIKVGNAWIKITPELDHSQLKAQLDRAEKEIAAFSGKTETLARQTANLRAKLEEYVTARYGEEATKRVKLEQAAAAKRTEYSQSETAAMMKAFAAVTEASAKAEKAKTIAKEKEARQRERIDLNARNLEVRYGTEVAAAYRKNVAEMMKENKGLSLVRINEAKQWSAAEILEQRKVAAENEKQAMARAAQVKTLSALVIRQAQFEATEAVKTARTAQAAYTSAYNTRKAQVLATMNYQKAADISAAQGLLATAQAAKKASQQHIKANDSTVRSLQDNANKVSKSWTKATYNMGQKINSVGSAMGEFGRNVNRNMVTPLLAAASAMSYLGIKAADSIMQSQSALEKMGVSPKDASQQLNVLKDYGTQTPYKVEDMFQFGTLYTRAAQSHGLSSKKATKRSTDLVMSIGDLAAYSGITDPEMVKRAFQAVATIQEADRSSLRNVKSLAQNAGLTVQELATLLGFKDRDLTKEEIAKTEAMKKKKGANWKSPTKSTAASQMMAWMQDAMNTGGVPGESVVAAILSKGKKIGTGTDDAPAKRLGTATISARLSNMFEQAKYGLSDMFISPTGKGGQYQYTGAGAALMNKGGLLDTVSGLGAGLKEPSGKLIAELFKDLTVLGGWVKKAVKVIKDHPAITDTVIQIGKFAAMVGIASIALGAVVKTFGLLTKVFSPVAGLAKGLFKGTKGAAKIGNQVVRGVFGSNGDSFRERYRNARAASNGGDDRSLGRRAVDSVRGGNSQVEEIQVDTDRAKRKIEELDTEIEGLRTKIRGFKDENFNEMADSLAGADRSVKDAAEKAAKAVREADTATTNLKGLRLQALNEEFNKVTENTSSLKRQVEKAVSGVSNLNGKGLGALEGELTDAKGKSKALDSSLKEVAKQAGNVNGKTLRKVKGEVDNVKDAADDARGAVGGGKSSLNSRLGQLNGMSTGSVVKQIKALKDALDDAAGKAGTLNSRLNSISEHAPGSGSGSKGKPKKPGKRSALGGVLPGYTPGRDVHVFSSPTAGELHLSGGESVMRPEWTAAMGAGEVDRLNNVARTKGVSGVRQAMKFAKGGILGKLGLDQLVEASKVFNVGSDARGALATMLMDSSSRSLGGGVQKGVVGSGTDSAHFVGKDFGAKFRGMYDFMTKDSWDILKKLPIPDGYTQVIGTIGGALSPITGQYFWDDVWKGKGNVLERGQDYLGDLFSTKTLTGLISNLFGGLWDSAKSLWNGATGFITDPVGFITDGVEGVWEMTKNQYTSVVDQVQSLREVWDSPLDYASQVIGDVYSTAKDQLPNLEGLFDFSGDGLSSKKPDIKGMVEGQVSTPGVGDSVSRWTPQVKAALAQLGLPASDLGLVLQRIKVESGGNPKAINNWDINAKNGTPSQGLMQTIPGTFNAYAGPYKSRGITDPMASIYAGLNYAVHRYGSGWRKALSGTKGYAKGTDGASRGWAWVGEEGPELVNFNGGETVLDHQDSMLAASNVKRGYASGTSSTRTTGLAADAKKGVSTLNTAVSKLYQIITKAFTSNRIGSGTANSLNKWLDKQNKSLQKLVGDRTTLATKLKDANTKLSDIKKQETDMATSIADQATEQRSLSSLFNTEGVSVSSAINGLKERLAAIKSFQSNITKLSSAGFSKEIIAEIANAGPEEGGAMAKELLNATEAQVEEFNSNYSAIGTASTALGKSVAGTYYATGKKAAQALVDGLTADDKKLQAGIDKLASTIVKTLKSKLKISSKSPVDSSLASLLTWLTGQGQAVKGGGNTSAKKTTRTTTTYSTDSQGRKVTTVTTTTTDPAKGTTTAVTKRTVGGKTTTSTRVSKIKGYATGTRSAARGVALVGEKGPELINFKGGERVFNDKDTAGMIGPRYEIHVHEAKAEDTTQSVLRALKYAETMAAL